MHARAETTHRPVPKTRQSAFTLIELLTVIAIIGLLVGMVVPTLQSIVQAMRRAETMALIQNLDNGCHMYKMSATGNKYFPGQQYYDDSLKRGQGSADLAKALFTDPNGVYPTGAYAPFQPSMLDDPNDTKGAIMDTLSARLPVLYYPGKRGAAPKNRFKEKHNSAYLYAAVKGNSYTVEDSNSIQFAPGFLLISTGLDSLYFTGDDIKSWK